MQLTLQKLLDRRLQAEEPSLGLGSAITKERKQNEHQTTKQTLHYMGVLLPWEALYEFGRMICLGFVGTFGGTPSPGLSWNALTYKRRDGVIEHTWIRKA